MKQLVYIFSLLTLSFSLQAQHPNLNISGTISQEDQTALNEALVHVTRDGKVYTSFFTPYNGTYLLYLDMGSEYVVSVSKEGYVKKFFTVSTVGVKNNSGRKKFSVMIADLELMENLPGVDYSALEQPMNKYYYNSKIDDFEYDEAYLKSMLVEIKKIKSEKKEMMKLAKQKNTKDQMLASDKTGREKREALQAARLKTFGINNEVKTVVAKAPPVAEPKILKADALVVNIGGEYITALLVKYPQGVTEEIIQGNHVIIIQRVLVQDKMAWVYHKKMFDWGGVACFRDGKAITEGTFEFETKKNS